MSTIVPAQPSRRSRGDWVRAVELDGLKPQRASALDLLANEGRAIGDELRRRQ